MKKLLLIAFLLMNLMAVEAAAQCNEIYDLCTKQLSKEDRKAGWFINKQSQSLSFKKDTIYETSITAYEGFEYRLLVCSDIAGGTDAKFQLAHDVMTTVTDSLGNSSIEKQRQVIFDNTVDNPELYVLFRSSKTEEYYLSVTMPAVGKSKNKKLSNTDFVCLGVRLEHRRTSKSSL